MSPLAVHIKHAGKVYDLQLDPDLPASVFKDAVYQVTGVPPDRMKVMVKGGVLKVSVSPNGCCELEISDSMDFRMIPIGKKLAPRRYVLSRSLSRFFVAPFSYWHIGSDVYGDRCSWRTTKTA
jgi:hypothetical protein